MNFQTLQAMYISQHYLAVEPFLHRVALGNTLCKGLVTGLALPLPGDFARILWSHEAFPNASQTLFPLSHIQLTSTPPLLTQLPGNIFISFSHTVVPFLILCLSRFTLF